MKTKLKRTEMEAVTKMVVAIVTHWEPNDDLFDMLLFRMMERLKIDLVRKVVEYKNEYKMTWHPERALAFACIMSAELDNMKAHPFEHNILLQLINQIRQESIWTPAPLFSQSYR